MKYGFDYYDTLSVAPKIYRQITKDILDSGSEVHIVTAVAKKNEARVRSDIKRSRIPHTQVHVIDYDDYREVPFAKVQKCKELGIKFFIDDREDTCKLMFRNEILAVKSLGEL